MCFFLCILVFLIFLCSEIITNTFILSKYSVVLFLIFIFCLLNFVEFLLQYIFWFYLFQVIVDIQLSIIFTKLNELTISLVIYFVLHAKLNLIHPIFNLFWTLVSASQYFQLVYW